MVGLTRVELVTSRLSGVRSDQLSYRPMHALPLQINLQKEKTESLTWPALNLGLAKDVTLSPYTLERR